MANDDSGYSDTNKFCAMIGHVCLQWALLELNLLGLLSSLESVSTERAEILFGGLDMLPRCGMAINLARHHRLPGPMIKRIETVRKKLQSGIADRRNQAIHGAHARSDIPGHVRLRMVRWKGAKSVQHISIKDMHDLAMEIAALASEADAIWVDYGRWKFGGHSSEHVAGEFAHTNPSIRLKIAQYIKTRVDHLRGWFKS